MPRPWAVEAHVLKLDSTKREAPWDKPMASEEIMFRYFYSS